MPAVDKKHSNPAVATLQLQSLQPVAVTTANGALVRVCSSPAVTTALPVQGLSSNVGTVLEQLFQYLPTNTSPGEVLEQLFQHLP